MSAEKTLLVGDSVSSLSRARSFFGNVVNTLGERVLAGKDTLSIAVEKATAPTGSGHVKEKHLQSLLQELHQATSSSSPRVCRDLVEALMLRCHALPPWQTNPIAAMKVLMLIYLLTDKGFETMKHNFHCILLLLQDMQQECSTGDAFVERLIRWLHYRIEILQEFGFLAELVINRNIVTQWELTNCLKNTMTEQRFPSTTDADDRTRQQRQLSTTLPTFLSSMLALQQDALHLLRRSTPSRSHKDRLYLETMTCAQHIVLEDCQARSAALNAMFTFAMSLPNEKSDGSLTIQDTVDVRVLWEQWESIENELRQLERRSEDRSRI